MIKFIEKMFYHLILKERIIFINHYEKKINKYEHKLLVSQMVLKEIKEDTKELLDKGTYL